MIKYLLILLGTASLGFGIVGIIIPGLPTTPFLLLSAGLYLRGSEKLYRMLIQSKYFGPYISKFRDDKGMTLKAKIIALLLMWCMIFLSSLLVIDNQAIDLVLYITGFIGSVVMGIIIPTIQVKNRS